MARIPEHYHLPHPDSRLYDETGIIAHPLQRNIHPSPWHGLHERAWALINSVIPNKPVVQPIRTPLIQLNHLVPRV